MAGHLENGYRLPGVAPTGAGRYHGARRGKPAHAQAHGRSLAGVVGWVRAHLTSEADHEWCPGTGTQVSRGATEHGAAWCPSCPKRVRTEAAPMARYRIIGEHTR